LQIAEKGWKRACSESIPLRKGLNVVNGKVVYDGVADAFNLPFEKAETVL
jgi:alanine dehydrogenase